MASQGKHKGKKSNGNGAGQAGPPPDAGSAAQTSAEVQRLTELARQQAKNVHNKLPLVGPIMWLYMHTPTYKHLFMADIEWLVLPPLILNQFKLYLKDEAPVAYASWAFVSEDVEKRLATGQLRLGPGDWKSGDRLWLIDLVAPFGGAQEILKDLREVVFPGRNIKQLMPDAQGVRIVEWPASKPV